MESGAAIQIARKQWRAVAANSVREGADEDLERQKMNQSGERTVYEESEQLDIDFCSGTSDAGLSKLENDDPLQQRLHGITRQREELEQLEIEIRAQFIVRAEIMRIRNEFDEQVKQHAGIAVNLQEQLEERDHHIRDLEQKLEERERELCAKQMETNEAVWAKDDLLREQDNELATIRRERDNADAERAQHLAQIEDLKEQLHEKERQVQEMDEQHRAAQDVLFYKDEQLRDAQTWMARIQEMDVYHSNNNHTLQAELRERTDQFNQLWLGCQRQLADVERHHLQTIHQLQLQLAEAREQNHMFSNHSSLSQKNVKDEMPPYTESKSANQYDAREDTSSKDSISAISTVVNGQANLGVLANGSVDGAMPIILPCDVSANVEHATALPIVPPSVLGASAFLPNGPMPAMQQFVVHRHGIAQSIQRPIQVPVPSMGQFQPIRAALAPQKHSLPQQHQQSISENYQSAHQCESSQVQRQPSRQPHLDYQFSEELQALHYQEQQEPQTQQEKNPDVVIGHGEQQALKPKEEQQLQQSSQLPWRSDKKFPEQHGSPESELPAQFCQQEEQLHLEAAETSVGSGLQNLQSSSEHQTDIELLQGQSGDEVVTRKSELLYQQNMERRSPVLRTSASVRSSQSGRSNHLKDGAISGKSVPDTVNFRASSHSTMQSPTLDGSCKASEPPLLDERALLACLVRAIPAEATARVRISTTGLDRSLIVSHPYPFFGQLPNRLGKMLSPRHWHDYKKRYGRLEEFVACHPELFVIEGDFVHLQEGAHAMISATTAVAKVAAAAAAASSPLGSAWLPTVAVTPVAQVHRLRKGLLINQKDGEHNSSGGSAVGQTVFAHRGDLKHANGGILKQAEDSALLTSLANGGIKQIHGVSGVNTATASDSLMVDGQQSDGFSLANKTDGLSIYLNSTNGANYEKAIANGFHGKGSSDGRKDLHFVHRQQEKVARSGSYVKQ